MITLISCSQLILQCYFTVDVKKFQDFDILVAVYALANFMYLHMIVGFNLLLVSVWIVMHYIVFTDFACVTNPHGNWSHTTVWYFLFDLVLTYIHETGHPNTVSCHQPLRLDLHVPVLDLQVLPQLSLCPLLRLALKQLSTAITKWLGTE